MSKYPSIADHMQVFKDESCIMYERACGYGYSELILGFSEFVND